MQVASLIMMWLTTVFLCLGYASIVAQANPSNGTCPPFYSSCREAYISINCSGSTPLSGEYNLALMDGGNRYIKRVFCDMENTNCGEKGWMMVAALDMAVNGSKCPDGLDEGMYGSKRLCGNRGNNVCRSTTFSTNGAPYTEVCGFVSGFQDKTPDAFHGKNANIDSVYLDGISITHGMPRQHIWSYGAGPASDCSSAGCCPCNEGGVDNVATFAKSNWYCESGNPTSGAVFEFFPNDVLWDGKNCTEIESPCCRPQMLPYFRTEIDNSSTDSIELRICHDQGFADEDIPIEAYQIYVR